MALHVYNTLSRKLEPFTPHEPPVVKLYTCGPTVYDVAHIGNFRAYVFEDLLRRYLKFCGYRVIQVMNLTDVDDKTIRGARAAGVSLQAFTRPFKDGFFEDLKVLNIEPAEHYPAATDHISEMIALVETLMAKGYAYRSDDGSVYFRIAQFAPYGRLAHLDIAGMRPGARVAQDEYQKDNAADFALWKAWAAEDGDVFWESPWGRGRPGWHLECSAMSMKYLGPSFDLHTGGVDNIFPHHEDEIAQSEAATGQPFVAYWMHCGHLAVDGKKMSKSLGNCHSLRYLQDRGYTGRELRYTLMAAQYRQALNFTFEAVDAARAALQRLDAFTERLTAIAASGDDRSHAGHEFPVDGWLERERTAFLQSMDDDLNVPLALAALFDLVHAGNRRMDAGKFSPAEAAAGLHLFKDWDRILGFLRHHEAQADAAVVRLAEARQAARLAKNWAEADRLRQAVEAQGWIIQDAAGGFKLKRR